MKYNNATFWPTTNTKQWDINSLNANFKLAEWEWSNLEQTESLLSFWTKYEEAKLYPTAADITIALDNNGQGLLYHEGIIYSGLEVEDEELYKEITLPRTDPETNPDTIRVKPGSIIYTVDLSQPLSDSKRYLIIESPVKYGYNYTIVNGLLTFSWGVLNTWTRPIKGPTGASNWGCEMSFNYMLRFFRNDNELKKFKIPLSVIVDQGRFPLTYSNAYTLLFYKEGDSPTEEISIPHKSWIAFEDDAISHSYTYYLYIEFDVTAGNTWASHFTSIGPNPDPYNLLIW